MIARTNILARQFTLCLAVASCLPILIPQPAVADILRPPDWISYSHTPQGGGEGRFVVKLNQTGHWSKLQNDTTTWTVRLKIDEDAGHLKVARYYLAPKFGYHGLGSPYGAQQYVISGSEHTSLYSTLRASQPVVIGLLGKIDETFNQQTGPKSPQAICAARRQELLAQGLQLYHVLAKDWTVQQTAFTQVRTDFKVPLATGGHANWSYLPWINLPVTVECKGDKTIAGKVAPLIATLDPDALPAVESASLTLFEQANAAGLCKVKLSGAVKSKHANTKIRFRYEHTSGKKSNIHEVTTDHAKTAMFDHSYDIPNGPGPEGGAIRMIGVAPGFETGWQSYAMNCVKPPATGLTAVLPPKLSMKVITEKTKMIGGQICPIQLRLLGRLEGRGDFSGQAAFVGDSYLSAPQAYEISRGENRFVVAYRDLKWGIGGIGQEAAAPQAAATPRSQRIRLGFNVTGPSNTVIASLPQKDRTIKCVFPKVNATLLSSATQMTAAPKPTSGGKAPAGQAKAQLMIMVKPDLRIERTAAPMPKTGVMTIVVVNIGKATSQATRLQGRMGKKTARAKVPSLAPGGKATIRLGFGASIKKRPVKLTVDPRNKVAESDERNNSKVVKP